MSNNTNQTELLFTPGPLNTSTQVRQAMTRDIGSRSDECIALTQRIQSRLLEVAGANELFVPVLIQGSGTFAVEAMLTSLVPAQGKLLVVDNGIYAKRMAQIAAIHQLHFDCLSLTETESLCPEQLDRALTSDPTVTHVAVVHYETGLGVLNDLAQILVVCAKHDVKVLVDAMSSFAAIDIDFSAPALLCVAASANKCLHGVPGIGFVIARRQAIIEATTPRSLTLDLNGQWQSFEQTGQWRFTPPTHVLLALDQAIEAFLAQGGQSVRLAHYQKLNVRLNEGLNKLAVKPLIVATFRAPIINTFVMDASFDVEQMFLFLASAGIQIYPTKASQSNSFRIGCIGELCEADIDCLLHHIGLFITEAENG
jgi:2-aminoethylphosphonate-pyruvate transaminase